MKDVKHKQFSVYKHTNLINGKVYIGITSKQPEQRWRNGLGYMGQGYFWKAIKKYSWDNFKHEVLLTELTQEEACDKEIELISFYKSNNSNFGYNLSSGGEQTHLGCKHNEETKIKMSNNHADFKGSKSTSSVKIICLDTLKIFDSIGEASRFLNTSVSGIHNVLKEKSKSCIGLHFVYLKDYDPNKEYDLSVGPNEETKIKISNSKKGKPSWNKGIPFSEESKLKMRNSKLGKVTSEETKKKLSIALMNNSNSKKIICVETREVFKSIADAGRILNLSFGNISSVCRGERKTTGGLHFKYYNNGDKNE